MPNLISSSPPVSGLRPRADESIAARMARSAAAADGAMMRTADFDTWFARRRAAHHFQVDRIPFDRLDDWGFAPQTGNLGHRSGRFFTVEGMHVSLERGQRGEWTQPIIRQPEVGVLGILVKEIDGVLHWLMQAKMEPGNVNLMQLSPTVQATRSNYTRVHRGQAVKYLDYFVRDDRRVLADVLQSEHGAWFLRKCNRNMIVEVVDDVPLEPDFCWLTFGQISELLHRDNLVNMDARTVLACAPVIGDRPADGAVGTAMAVALARSREPGAGALHSDAQLLSWLTAERSRQDVTVRTLPLRDLPGWRHLPSVIEHAGGAGFRVVAVSVRADNREVARWTQPLIEPLGAGTMAFLVREFGGVLHVLVNARVEAGLLDTVELAPTVQHVPGELVAEPPEFLDTVLTAGPDRLLYQAVHSEEGGRFLAAQSRYLLVEADGALASPDEPPGYRWATPAQLSWLAQHGHYLNVQARTLLACLNALPGRA